MARHLARIHGTEEDKVNCPFYFKIGACRHADRCSRIHHRPAFSQTILIKHVYRHPIREAELKAAREGRGVDGAIVDEEGAREDFLAFFEDFFQELSKFGRLEALHVCDNLGDHMIGHVYAKFAEEEEAADALNVMNGRYYDGRRMEVEFSPVTDFREARCRDFDEDTCRRGGFCNFMHIKPVPLCLVRDMEDEAEDERRREEMERMERRRREERRDHRGGGGDRRRGRRDRERKGGRRGGGGSRSRSRSRSHSKSGSRDRGGGSGVRYE
ncbi:hypothetical protein ACHAXA_007229 [Cyclostephanos tholiformis]|uniref:Splicing factor U2af 38 kDa subunit n=1 Tax=Cyclostephanos tholiformis TaxID=382380 RepID=A0ABD3RGP9_9STRA